MRAKLGERRVRSLTSTWERGPVTFRLQLEPCDALEQDDRLQEGDPRPVHGRGLSRA